MHTIVVVDDSEDFRALIARLLTEEGYIVCTARTGEEAAQLVREIGPTLVILDVSLPGGGARSVLSEVERFPNTQLLVYSSAGDRDALRTAEQSRATATIKCWPIDLEELVRQIRSSLGRTSHNASPAMPEEDESPPFAFRLSSQSVSTAWLFYRKIQFYGDEMHIRLSDRYRLPFNPGELVTFETRLGRTQASLGGVTDQGVLVLRLCQGSESRLSSLFENSWD